MINRRNFLKSTTLLAAGSMVSCNLQNATSAAKNFGLQIYSLTVREADVFYSDLPASLKKVAEMGYSTLELAGYNSQGRIGAVPMADFKKYCDDAGLKIVSTHVGLPGNLYNRDGIEQAKEFWKRAADHHAAVGCKYLLQPGEPPMRSTEDVSLIAEMFNEAGKVAKSAGLTFGFHNHSGEFMRVVPGGTEKLPFQGRRTPGSKIIFDALIEETDPTLVVFELDVYWAVMGLSDPVEYLRKYPDRIRLLHIKDRAVLGESGFMNFQKIFEVGYENKITDFFVELEGYREGTQFEGVKGCADYLMKAPFVK